MKGFMMEIHSLLMLVIDLITAINILQGIIV